MLFVKMLPELVAHKSGETKQSTEDKEEAEARLTLTHRVKSMNTEEMVLSEILRDVDEALKSSSPSLTTATTADAATSTATSTATSASVCIALPQHVSSSIEQFRNTTSQALASVPTLLWIDPILALFNRDQKAARPYIAALFVLTRLQSENSAHGIAARLPQNVRHLFSEAITKLCLQLRNWLQHNLDVTQHRLFDQSFRSLLLRCERESFSLLSLEHGTEQNGAISMLSCLRANSSLLHQVCAHVKQSVGIRFIILLQLCEHIEKQMYMETLREERTRRAIDSVLVICQEADSLVERVGTYGSGGGGGVGGGGREPKMETIVDVHVRRRRCTSTRDPLLYREGSSSVMGKEMYTKRIKSEMCLDDGGGEVRGTYRHFCERLKMETSQYLKTTSQ